MNLIKGLNSVLAMPFDTYTLDNFIDMSTKIANDQLYYLL